jgi:hypothetical protein
MQAITYQLKYCERCGALRLRRADSRDNYCRDCEQLLFNMPARHALQAKLLRRKPRAAKTGLPALPPAAPIELACGRAQ